MHLLFVLAMVLQADNPVSSSQNSQALQERTTQKAGQNVENFGLDLEHFDPGKERVIFAGQEITAHQAKALLDNKGLDDDSEKLRLTIIGTQDERQRVLADLHGPLADLAGAFLVQSYDPDNWAVARAGFKTDGHPTIYVQDPTGKVLHRQDDYQDGAQGLRRALEALRRPDPNYTPNKDPDLRRPKGFLGRLAQMITAPVQVFFAWVVVAIVLYALLVLGIKGWLWYAVVLLARFIPEAPDPESDKKVIRTKQPAQDDRSTTSDRK